MPDDIQPVPPVTAESNATLPKEPVGKAAGFKVQGHTKVTREEGRDRSADTVPDVVQQGGGGAVDAKTGKPA